MPDLVVLLFAGNLVLTLTDASLAYHQAHRIVAFISPGLDCCDAGVKKIRSFLPLMVALYSVLDCYAYSLRHAGYLVGITFLLLVDIVLQWHLAVRGEKIRG